MESLLRWSIQNSTPVDPTTANSNAPPAPRKDLDPAIIDHILGKPDSELMKEALNAAMDERLGDDERVAALDNLEMLVENIDNANDLEKLKMWQPLHALLASSSDEIKTQTLWVIGTAVQNNPKAQRAYFTLDPLPTILAFLSPSVRSPALRSKAVYCLSGILKHNAFAVQQLDENSGWEVLGAALENSDITVRRKTVFLLSTLLTSASNASTDNFTSTPAPATTSSSTPNNSASLALGAPTTFPSTSASTTSAATLHSSETSPPNLHTPTSNPTNPTEPIHANSHSSMLSDPSSVDTAPLTLNALHQHGILKRVVNGLEHPLPWGVDGAEEEGDEDFEEKAGRLLWIYVREHGGGFDEDEKSDLRSFLERKVRASNDAGEGTGEVLGMTKGELEVLQEAVA